MTSRSLFPRLATSLGPGDCGAALTVAGQRGAMSDSIPFTVRPLQPTLVRPFHRDGWVFEIKIDGWRIVAYKSGREVRLVSRTGVDHTPRFRNLAAAVAQTVRSARAAPATAGP